MAKQKKKLMDKDALCAGDTLRHEEKVLPIQADIPRCPLCRESIPDGRHFYCPHCKREIDYLLEANITDISDERIQEIEKSTARLWYSYALVIGIYTTTWLLLSWFILRNCMNVFRM